MSTYKVLQDIEAEDKLLGPLTLKQFIFAIIFLAIGFVEFKLATTVGLSLVRWPIVLALLPVFIIFGFLAAPISRDQPNDIWLLARVRFIVKPHKRIWNQDGISELVTINVPKKLEHFMTNGLNQREVQSRLSALASTLDSRGWATKNVDVNMFAQPGYLSTADGSDRLVEPSNLPVNEGLSDVRAADDMMDLRSNPTAQHLDQMMQASTTAHMQQVINSVQQQSPSASATPPDDYWFMNQSSTPPPTLPVGMSTFQQTTVVAPGADDTTSAVPTSEEEALIKQIEANKAADETYYPNLKTLQPIGSDLPTSNVQPLPSNPQPQPSNIQPPTSNTDDDMLPPVAPPTSIPQPSKPTPNPAILKFAGNDDLNIATIARQAKQISESDGEVVISLR
jgi:hypothetical protein